MISAWFERFCSQWSVYSKSDQTCLFFQMSTICFRCWAFLWSPIRRDEGKACGSFSIFCGSSLILRSRVQAQPQYEKRGIWTWFNYKITRDCINFFPRTKETILSGDCGQGTSPGTITFFFLLFHKFLFMFDAVSSQVRTDHHLRPDLKRAFFVNSNNIVCLIVLGPSLFGVSCLSVSHAHNITSAFEWFGVSVIRLQCRWPPPPNLPPNLLSWANS